MLYILITLTTWSGFQAEASLQLECPLLSVCRFDSTSTSKMPGMFFFRRYLMVPFFDYYCLFLVSKADIQKRLDDMHSKMKTDIKSTFDYMTDDVKFFPPHYNAVSGKAGMKTPRPFLHAFANLCIFCRSGEVSSGQERENGRRRR